MVHFVVEGQFRSRCGPSSGDRNVVHPMDHTPGRTIPMDLSLHMLDQGHSTIALAYILIFLRRNVQGSEFLSYSINELLVVDLAAIPYG
jgi:hypothetical protein